MQHIFAKLLGLTGLLTIGFLLSMAGLAILPGWLSALVGAAFYALGGYMVGAEHFADPVWGGDRIKSGLQAAVWPKTAAQMIVRRVKKPDNG